MVAAEHPIQTTTSLTTKYSPEPARTPHCAECDDKGYINCYRLPSADNAEGFIPAWDEVRFLTKWTDAVHIGVQDCECVAKRRMDNLSKFFKLPKKREHCSFEWFDALDSRTLRGKLEARKQAQAIADGQMLYTFEDIAQPGLVLSGKTGIGKSGLAVSIAKARIAAGVKCLYIDYNEFLDEVYEAQQRMFDRGRREIADDEPANPFEFVDTVANAPFLVLDDFGDMARDKPLTDYQRDKTYAVIRRRYENELPSVITTNLSSEQIYALFGKRIADRIGESWFWCDMDGVNLRFER